MKVKNYEFNKPIHTVEELSKYYGKPVYLWYDEMKNGSRQVLFAWIKTVYSAYNPYASANGSVRHAIIEGYNALAVIKNFEKTKFFINENDHIEPSHSNAQRYVRTLTEEEFEMYRKITMKRRILLEK